MHAFVKAFSKVTPCRWSCVSPGRFCSDHPSGKCWMARSWSVMNITTFIPARLAGTAPAAPRAPAARPPSHRDPAVAADRWRNCLREMSPGAPAGGVASPVMAETLDLNSELAKFPACASPPARRSHSPHDLPARRRAPPDRPPGHRGDRRRGRAPARRPGARRGRAVRAGLARAGGPGHRLGQVGRLLDRHRDPARRGRRGDPGGVTAALAHARPGGGRRPRGAAGRRPSTRPTSRSGRRSRPACSPARSTCCSSRPSGWRTPGSAGACWTP